MVDELEQWVTAVSAVIAAGTGIWSVWWQTRGKLDRFLVGLDSVSPTIEQETVLHVVNVSDHAIALKDWGFIEPDGRLNSIPLAHETMDLLSDEVAARGSSVLVNRNDIFEMGYVRRKRPIGAYAISVTQSRPRLMFDSSVPYVRRIWLRLRLRFGQNYV